MHFLHFLSVVATAAVVSAEPQPRALSMPVYRDVAKYNAALNLARNRKAKRDPFSVTLDGYLNGGGFYLVNVTVGTPGQPIVLDIDTGSSDVWMFGPKSCDQTTSLCYGGAYDADSSSTVQNACADPNECPPFSITYGTPGSGVQGYYFQDVFNIGGKSVKNLTMAFATKAVYTTTGIMGIGFPLGESLEDEEGQTYPNLVSVMETQGLIPSQSYSLYLDDLAAGEGTVLFGGYDTDKFEGDLSVLDIQPAEAGLLSRMLVIWSSIGVTDKSGSVLVPTTSAPQSALLDSGTALTVVPQDVFTSLANYFGAVNSQEVGTWVVNCDLGYGTLDFGFGGPSGPVISVPFSELAIPATDNQGNIITYKDGSPVCMLGLDVASSSSGVILGDTFLRSAYVVYDLQRKQIGIAQTRFNVSTSNVKDITPGSGNLAGASSVVASGTTLSYLPGSAATVLANPAGGAVTRSANGHATGKASATVASGTIVGGIKTTYANRATDVPGAVSPTGSGAGTAASASSTKASAGISLSSAFGLQMQALLVGALFVAIGMSF